MTNIKNWNVNVKTWLVTDTGAFVDYDKICSIWWRHNYGKVEVCVNVVGDDIAFVYTETEDVDSAKEIIQKIARKTIGDRIQRCSLEW